MWKSGAGFCKCSCTWDQFFTCVLGLRKSNLSPIPHSRPSTVCFCFSGYSCRLVTHGMSLIIVNEDSLDVSRPLSSSCRPAWFTSVYTLYSIGTVCVGGNGGVLSRLPWELGCGPQPDWWVGLFVCSQVQVIKVSGVPLEKGMKREVVNYHFFPSLYVSFTTFKHSTRLSTTTQYSHTVCVSLSNLFVAKSQHRLCMCSHVHMYVCSCCYLEWDLRSKLDLCPFVLCVQVSCVTA